MGDQDACMYINISGLPGLVSKHLAMHAVIETWQ